MDELDELRLEVERLCASRRRLVAEADADRRLIERRLHEGVQQQLVAVAVDLERAGRLAEADPAATKALLDELAREVEQALAEAARLAHEIYPPLLEGGGLAVALRSAAAAADVRASVDVPQGANLPLEAAAAIYWSFLGLLEHAQAASRATVAVREEPEALAFELVLEPGEPSQRALERLHDRVEALGGRLTDASEPGTTRVSGVFPVS